MDSVTKHIGELGKSARDGDTAAREELSRMAEGGNEIAQAELNGLDARWTEDKPTRSTSKGKATVKGTHTRSQTGAKKATEPKSKTKATARR